VFGEGQRAVALTPAQNGYGQIATQESLLRIYLTVGDQEKALDRLKALLKIPSQHLSPGWLRIDPTFDPLHKDPRFQKLVAVGE
jgi:hypothetical protein